jgi:hypothetical protein
LQFFRPFIPISDPPYALGGTSLSRWAPTHHHAYEKQSDKNHEKDPCDLSCRSGNPEQAEQAGYQPNHQKSQSPV